MSLLDRMIGTETPTISSHQFYAAIVGLAAGELTRTQIETGFNIPTSGTDAAELDFLIDTYTGIVSDDFSGVGNAAIRNALEGLSVGFKQERYKNTLHAIFLLTEHGQFEATFTKTDVMSWLTDAAL